MRRIDQPARQAEPVRPRGVGGQGGSAAGMPAVTCSPGWSYAPRVKHERVARLRHSSITIVVSDLLRQRRALLHSVGKLLFESSAVPWRQRSAAPRVARAEPQSGHRPPRVAFLSSGVATLQ